MVADAMNKIQLFKNAYNDLQIGTVTINRLKLETV